MNFYTFGPVAVVLDAAYWLVTNLTTLLSPVAGELSAALAIVVLTLIVRTALIPVGVSQVRAEYTRRRIAPKLQELQKRYRNPEVLARKTTELYAAEKASPFAGMLPALAQAPVLSIIYGLFILATIGDHANALLSHDILGAALGTSLFGGVTWPSVLVYVALLAVIATVAVLSRRANMRFAPLPSEGSMQAVSRVLSWMPLITVAFATFVPLAATLYLAVTTTWTAVERAVLRARLDPNRPDAVASALPA